MRIYFGSSCLKKQPVLAIASELGFQPGSDLLKISRVVVFSSCSWLPVANSCIPFSIPAIPTFRTKQTITKIGH